MDKKVLAVLLIVVVVGIAAAASAVLLMDDEGELVGVTYYGNGGKTEDGKTSDVFANSKAVPCFFSNGNRLFIDWNTKDDGSGDTYKVGADVAMGLSLYAQWGAEYYILSTQYTGPPSGLNLSIMDAGGPRTFLMTGILPIEVYVPCLISVTDGSDWSYESAWKVFVGRYNGKSYSLELTSTGLENVIVGLDADNEPTIAFDGVSGSGSISVKMTLLPE